MIDKTCLFAERIASNRFLLMYWVVSFVCLNKHLGLIVIDHFNQIIISSVRIEYSVNYISKSQMTIDNPNKRGHQIRFQDQIKFFIQMVS